MTTGDAGAERPPPARYARRVAVFEGTARARRSDGATGLPAPAHEPLNATEERSFTTIRRLGILGALLLGIGSLGAGAAPVLNPVQSIPVLRLFGRTTTVSLAIALSGMALMVAAWLLAGRYARPGRDRQATPAQMVRAIALWITPLMFVPPLFSRDVYSYLAQSEIVHRGMDPYSLGPAQALGITDPLTMGVSNVWRETPAPYGPFFLEVGSWISAVSGNQVVVGVLLQRVVALIGIGLIIWTLPRLARRFGVEPTAALWLGAGNPLVAFHLVAGVHNEAIGIGLLMLGLEIGMRRLPIRIRGDSPPPLAPGELRYIVLGAAVMTLAAAVKINAIIALGFFGVMIARRWHGRISDLLRAAAGLLAVFLVIIVLVSVGTGLGFGWVGALGTPGMGRSLISPVNQLASLTAVLAMSFGLGNHIESFVPIMGTIGLVIAAAITVKLLWSSFRWRLRPMIGLGLAMGAVMGLHVAVHPWWMLWAVVPLAATAGTSRFRVVAMVGSALLAMVVPPTGSGFDGRGFVLPQAYLAALIVLALALLVIRRTVPLWPEKPVPTERSTL